MSSRLFLFAPLLISLCSALPNPTAAPIAARAAASAEDTDGYDAQVSEFFQTAASTAKAALSSEFKAASSEDAAYASQVSHFFQTAAPSAKAALSSEFAAESNWYASLTADYATHTVGTSEAAALSSEYAAWTSEAAAWSTYTGTSDLFDYETVGTDDFFGDMATADLASTTQPPSSTPWNPSVEPTAVASAWPNLRVVDQAAVYGVQCRKLGQWKIGDLSMDTTTCQDPISRACAALQQASENDDVDKWHREFQQHGNGCAAAFWLPKAAAGTSKVPTQEECEGKLYGQMLSSCFKGDAAGQFDTARVNLVYGQNKDEEGACNPGSCDNGQQVNAGAPSYQIDFMH